MKNYYFKLVFGFMVSLVLFFGFSEECNAQWWKDTVWTKKTDQGNGFTMLKFSKNDSIIVGHGYEMDLFFDAKTGYEIIRIPGNNEVLFINNDLNFIRTNEPRTRIEIFDAKTYQVIDTIENDNTVLTGSIDISSDERLMVATIPSGIRIFDLVNKQILRTKIYPPEENRVYCDINHVFFNCDNSKVIGHLNRTYQDPEHPGDSKYYKNYASYVVYDVNTLDSIDAFSNSRGMQVSPNCKYYATATGDVTNGVEVYDFNTKQLLWKIPVNGPSLTGIEFSPDDKYLVTASNNGNIGMSIWKINEEKMYYHYEVDNTYRNMNVSHSGKFIAFSIGSTIGVFKTHFDDVSVNEPFETDYILYPNPTDYSIYLTFELSTPQQLNYSIYSETGQKIKPLLDEYTLSGKITKTFDVSDLHSGTYFLRIEGENFSMTYKVLKMR